MKLLKSIYAWISGPLTPEKKTMPDENTEIGSAGSGFTDAYVAAEPLVVADAPVVTEPVVNTDTLKAVLAALGHDLDAVWSDAIALAKKAR